MFGTPVDLEVHRAVDSGDLYALDFSRIFPPEYNESTGPNTLYKLLRPELVKKFHIPLNNDALTRFSSDEENLAVNKNLSQTLHTSIYNLIYLLSLD